MCFKWYCDRYCTREPIVISGATYISPPNYLENIGYDEVYGALYAEFPECTILLKDAKYKTTTKEEILRFLQEDNTDKYEYVSEWYDCNNFSFRLLGNINNPDWGVLPFGFVWADIPGGGHAINCFIDNNREVWIIEPQNDAVFKLPGDWHPYLVVI